MANSTPQPASSTVDPLAAGGQATAEPHAGGAEDDQQGVEEDLQRHRPRRPERVEDPLLVEDLGERQVLGQVHPVGVQRRVAHRPDRDHAHPVERQDADGAPEQERPGPLRVVAVDRRRGRRTASAGTPTWRRGRRRPRTGSAPGTRGWSWCAPGCTGRRGRRRSPGPQGRGSPPAPASGHAGGGLRRRPSGVRPCDPVRVGAGVTAGVVPVWTLMRWPRSGSRWCGG